MAHAIFHMHQTSGTCAGMCMCDHMHWMGKTEVSKVLHIYLKFETIIYISKNSYQLSTM